MKSLTIKIVGHEYVKAFENEKTLSPILQNDFVFHSYSRNNSSNGFSF